MLTIKLITMFLIVGSSSVVKILMAQGQERTPHISSGTVPQLT